MGFIIELFSRKTHKNVFTYLSYYNFKIMLLIAKNTGTYNVYIYTHK